MFVHFFTINKDVKSTQWRFDWILLQTRHRLFGVFQLLIALGVLFVISTSGNPLLSFQYLINDTGFAVSPAVFFVPKFTDLVKFILTDKLEGKLTHVVVLNEPMRQFSQTVCGPSYGGGVL